MDWRFDRSPDLFKMLTPHKTKKRDQGDAFMRWRVQVPGDPVRQYGRTPTTSIHGFDYTASKVTYPWDLHGYG